MVVRASEVKPLAKELIFTCPDEHHTKVIQIKGMDVKLPVVCDNPTRITSYNVCYTKLLRMENLV